MGAGNADIILETHLLVFAKPYELYNVSLDKLFSTVFPIYIFGGLKNLVHCHQLFQMQRCEG